MATSKTEALHHGNACVLFKIESFTSRLHCDDRYARRNVPSDLFSSTVLPKFLLNPQVTLKTHY